MKNLNYLVSQGHSFMVDDENLFYISTEDLGHISRLGALVYTFLKAVMNGLRNDPAPVSEVLFDGLQADYHAFNVAHLERHPVLIRVDLMVDINGNWKIAEIEIGRA